MASDNVRCEVWTASLEDSLDYEAISYVWGTGKDVVRVATDEGDMFVHAPANLVAGLRWLRHRDLPRTIWADSICINQEDLPERAQQVRIMGDIYRNASRVLIWLGEPDNEESLSLACQLMNKLNEPTLDDLQIDYPTDDVRLDAINNTSEMRSVFGLEERNSPDAIHASLGLPSPSSPPFRALMELSSDSWWTRAWTWQEGYLAQDRMFFSGGWSWPCKLLLDIITGPLWKLMQAGILKKSPILSNVMPMISGLPTVNPYNTLGFMLPIRRGAGCKEPCDLVFSLLGAVSDTKFIDVDYNIPWELVFAQATMYVIESSGNFGILSHREIDRQASLLPSWIPDWRINWTYRPISSPAGGEKWFSATGSSRSVVSLSTDARMLVTKGLVFDRIFLTEGTEPLHPEDWESDISIHFYSKCGTYKIYDPTSETLSRVIRATHFLDSADFLEGRQRQRFTDEMHEIFEQIWITSDMADDAWREDDASRKNFMKLLWKFLHIREHQSVCNFVTRDKHSIGTAPTANIQPGDCVVFLLGGEVPVILRPSADPNCYEFICECYVHGYMYGEALVEARKAADPNHDATDTTWLQELSSDVPFPLDTINII